MSPCQRIDALTSAYLEDEASPSEARFIEGHLTACAECRRSVAEVQQTLDRLSRLPKMQVSSDFTQKVLARTRGLAPAGLEEPVVTPMPAPRRRAAWTAPLAAAAALAVVVLGGVSLLDRGPVEMAEQPRPTLELTADGTGSVGAPSARVPEVATLDQLYPGLDGQAESEPLGMIRDTYVMDDYQLMEPTGGGAPVLSRVSQGAADQVLVTF